MNSSWKRKMLKRDVIFLVVSQSMVAVLAFVLCVCFWR